MSSSRHFECVPTGAWTQLEYFQQSKLSCIGENRLGDYYSYKTKSNTSFFRITGRHMFVSITERENLEEGKRYI